VEDRATATGNVQKIYVDMWF